MPDSNAHILVVDDEAAVRRLLRSCFELEGYAVSEAETGGQAHDILNAAPVDLITLDLNLGSEDGFTIAREIRAHTDVPIVMVTGKGDTIDTVVGLEIGADDYITKPFHVREVLARVKTVLRRAQARPQATISTEGDPCADAVTFGNWTLHLGNRELRSNDNENCELTTGEFELLRVLVTNRQRVLSRDQIMDQVKGNDWNPLDRSIDNQIARLRKKIEPDPATPTYIKTVRGVGYTFASDVGKTAS
ncbi:MAG: response regulator [Hyphomicrobiaceae bacterium]